MKKLKSLKMKPIDLFSNQQDLELTEMENFISELECEIKKLEEHENFLKENKAFDWSNEFPKCNDDNGNFVGFDVVIGNPPYGVSVNTKCTEYFKKNYKSAKTIAKKQKGSTDTYVLFIEKAFNLAKTNGFVHFIVPISFTAGDSLVALHNLLESNCETITISSYAVRPQPIFDNAVVNTSVVEFKKTNTPCKQLYSTKMHRKCKNFDFNLLLKNIGYVDVLDCKLKGRIPKISLEIEKNILRKLFSIKNKIGNELLENNDAKIYYRAAGGRYFKIVTNYPTHSSAEKSLPVTEIYKNTIGAILSSNLFFWYYQIFSDNLNLKLYEIESFPFPKEKWNEKSIKEIEKLYEAYLIDIENNAIIKQTEKYKNISNFKEYKIGKSKHLIDKIDDFIGEAYGLTKEEVEFVKNYEIEFRL